MKLSLSVRIAEAPCKTRLNVPFQDLVNLAAELGYRAVCLRASAGGVQTPREELLRMREQVERAGLVVSMVTADSQVPLNNEQGPQSLRNIGPSLDVAEAVGSDLIRICMKRESDVAAAQAAADVAALRGIRLAHQCHTASLFEEVAPSIALLKRINRRNFGIIYEPINLLVCGQNYGLSALRELAPYLMNVYVQNHRLDPNGPAALETWCRGVQRFHHIPLWEPGGVNFPEVITALQAIGYDGYVTVHQAYAELMGPREAAVKSAEYLRSLGGFE
jgi:sugar phosphate isomerase/epimerase